MGQVLQLNLGLIATKGYSTCTRRSKLEPHHKIVFSVCCDAGKRKKRGTQKGR